MLVPQSLREIAIALANKEAYSEAELQLLANQALNATLDRKLCLGDSLAELSEQLAGVIALFPKEIAIDDLRYRLAHLYLREKRWLEAEEQLVEVKDYFSTETQIYSLLCRINQPQSYSQYQIENEVRHLASQLRSSKVLSNLRPKSTQEYFYNLLEILVYTSSNLYYNILGDYYKDGSTRVKRNITIKLMNRENVYEKIEISDFRFKKILESCYKEKFLILNSATNIHIEPWESELPPRIKILTILLAEKYPRPITSIEIINNSELKESFTSEVDRRKQQTISNWINKLEGEIKKRGFDSEPITTTRDPTAYKLNYPFLLINSIRKKY